MTMRCIGHTRLKTCVTVHICTTKHRKRCISRRMNRKEKRYEENEVRLFQSSLGVESADIRATSSRPRLSLTPSCYTTGHRINAASTLTMSQEDAPPIAALFVVVFDQKVGYVHRNSPSQTIADRLPGIPSHGSAACQMSTLMAWSISACHRDSMA